MSRYVSAFVSLEDPSAPIEHEAVIDCPECGREVIGHWIQGRDTADQRCGACGHVFEATWPGFTFEPEVVIVSPDGEVVRRGAA